MSTSAVFNQKDETNLAQSFHAKLVLPWRKQKPLSLKKKKKKKKGVRRQRLSGEQIKNTDHIKLHTALLRTLFLLAVRS